MGRLAFLILSAISAARTAADTTALRLHNSQYVSSGTAFYREDAAANNASFSVHVQRDKRWRKSLGAKFNVKNEYSASENWNYINVYQAHGHVRIPGGISAQAGRKIETWSSGEDEWRLGSFQPRYMQNKLRPETAGLTGLFVSSAAGSFVWTAGVLPVHVPELGAHFWVRDHKFTSRNPWFDPPAPSYKFRGETNDIHYSVDKPPVTEIMANPGAVAKVERSFASFGTRLSAAYKPVPQLLLGFPSLNRVVIGSTNDYLDVAVTPEVIYHWVAGSDVWFRAGGWQFAGTVMHDRPVGNQLRDGWTSQTFDPAWIGTLSAARAVLDGEAKVKLGFIKIEGGRGRDRGEFAGERSLFEGRFQYDEAYLAAVAVPVRRLLPRLLQTEARVVYDRVQNGGYVTLAAGYDINRDWRLDAEADVLGLLGDGEGEDGFFSTYRANDRMGMGMTYVF